MTKKILNEVGLLLVPAGAVGLFCQVLSVDAQRTAVYSFTAVLFVLCCLHRSWINTWVPSALVLAVFIGFGAIFFFNYENILLKDTGLIRRFQESADFQAELGTQISAANEEIWFFGTNFHISAVERRPRLLKQLRAGVRVRYLIVDPFTTNMPRLAKDFDQTEREFADECMKGLSDVLELRRLWLQDKLRGELEVRFFESTPRARVYVFDPSRPAGRTLFVPYMNRVNSPSLPGFLLDNSAKGVFGSYFGGITTLWNESKTLEPFFTEHPELRQ